MQNKYKRLALIAAILACVAATVVASTEISLDTPATLPSDI